MQTVSLGSRQRIYASFRDATRVLFDPVNVVLSLTWPAHAGKAPYTETLRYGEDARIVRQSVGVFYFSLLINFSGTVSFTWKSSGFGQEQTVTDQLRAI